MGNCINREAMVSWADEEEWEWSETEAKKAAKAEKRDEDGKVVAQPSTEVKIRITKKQLEELLRHVGGRGLPVEQLLAHLANTASEGCTYHSGHWRPALQSIPEVVE